MKLLVARHGETPLNQQKKFYGSTDVSLDAVGEEQAAQLVRKLNHTKLDYIFCSGLMRAQQTARPVVKQHDEAEVRMLTDLNEKGFGNWEGLNADEIQRSDPQNWERWLESPLTFTPPTVESFMDFKYRIKQGLTEILATTESEETALVVAHLGTLRVMHQLLLATKTDFWAIHFDAGCYSSYMIHNHDTVLTALNV